MNSENSTELDGGATAVPSSRDALQPWQLFTLAGLIGATVVVALSSGETPAGVILLSLTIFAAAAVGAGTLRMLGPYVGIRTEPPVRMVGSRTSASLERDKLLALRAIKELEFDRAMGKVSEQDFGEVGGRLRARAARLLRQIDAGNGYAQLIERELNARLGSSAAATVHVPAAAETMPTARSAARAGASAASATCAQCGTASDVDARFCKHCGARVEAVS